MRKNVLTILALFVTVIAFSQTKVGANVVYGTSSGLGLGVKASFDVSEKFKISPSVNYYFPEDIPGVSTTSMSFEADAHYFFELQDKFSLYPLAGLNVWYTSVSSSYAAFSASSTNFGLNLGGGANYKLSDKLTGFSEIKLMVTQGSQVVFNAGVMYSL
ncbi:outer membrane protein with beta-barrel domain [Tenacibaculum lutimaris]|uniref:Outer membrane protein with beta-barrel domain n=1 Tax=Tenacibaculum lutimaris TaxID=285258 RepID=A0A420E046_9FLAO|nr:outer membrane beta-barrel protein [Tenacibaculum lutimaris]RKF03460.1 outer membrane protein with beta-barrel domain [Tenacibaculum lutimaris]